MNDEELERYNNWLANPELQFGIAPFITKQKIIKDADGDYVFKTVVISPSEWKSNYENIQV